MKEKRILRNIIVAMLLFLCVLWSFNSAAQKGTDYPNANFITDAHWLKTHQKDNNLVIADVRSDKHFDGSLIPGAIRLDWSEFRYNDTGHNLAETFVGIKKAQEILGRHGITREDTIVLYDSVERDGGATASYVFWVLDLLGHDNKMILNRGIDAWKDAGFDLVTSPRETRSLLYQAQAESLQREKLIDGNFVYSRLGDYFYQIIDVRSKDEYIGNKGTKGLDGSPLKLGHIPTAVNINYQDAWTDTSSKQIKSYDELRSLYTGLDSSKGIIVYCNSGRRSSFSYFILRLMGFDRVFTYEASWKEWGNPDRFFPVERRENVLMGDTLPEPSNRNTASIQKATKDHQKTGESASEKPAGGYISCGG